MLAGDVGIGYCWDTVIAGSISAYWSDNSPTYEPEGNRSAADSPVCWRAGSTRCFEVVLQYFATPAEMLPPGMVGSSYEASAGPVAFAVVVRLGKRVFGI